MCFSYRKKSTRTHGDVHFVYKSVDQRKESRLISSLTLFCPLMGHVRLLSAPYEHFSQRHALCRVLSSFMCFWLARKLLISSE